MTAILYGAKGQSSTTSSLYTLNPATGAVATTVGAIGYAVTGLAFDPTTGILYGATSNNSTASPRALITINTTTGAGTLVGSLGLANPVTDISFTSAGLLYGYPGRADPFVSINKATGTAATIGSASAESGGGLTFDSGDVLYHIPFTNGRNIRTVATGTGVETSTGVTLGAGPGANGPNAAAFNNVDVCYVLWNINPTVHLVTVDIATGVVSDIGATDNLMDGLAWEVVPAPAPPEGVSIAFTDTAFESSPTWTRVDV